MKALPRGWVWSRVADLGDVMLGRQRSPKYHSGDHLRPYLRVKNVFEDRIDVSDVMEMNFTPAEFDRYRLEPGDVLLNEGQSPELVGRPAMYRGEVPGACFTNSLIRFRARAAIDPLFALYLFRHYLHCGRFRQEARITTNIAHLSASRFASIEVRLPPIAEQRRIVATIEEQFSRLDAAMNATRTAASRLAALRDSIYGSAVLSDWPQRPLGELLRQPLRNGFSAKASATGTTRIITLRAVTNEAFTDSNTKLADVDAAKARDLWLEPGDVLIERSNTPELVGTAALYRGEHRWAIFPDLAIRVRTSEELLPEFLALVLKSRPVRRYFQRAAQGISGSMPKIGQEDIRSLRVPVPTIAEQREAVERAAAMLELESQLDAALRVAARRAGALRRSILATAFQGELVPQDPDDEPASVLLERIAAERAAAPAARRTRRRVPTGT